MDEKDPVHNFTVGETRSWGDLNPILGTLEVVSVDVKTGTITLKAIEAVNGS